MGVFSNKFCIFGQKNFRQKENFSTAKNLRGRQLPLCPPPCHDATKGEGYQIPRTCFCVSRGGLGYSVKKNRKSDAYDSSPVLLRKLSLLLYKHFIIMLLVSSCYIGRCLTVSLQESPCPVNTDCVRISATSRATICVGMHVSVLRCSAAVLK